MSCKTSLPIVTMKWSGFVPQVLPCIKLSYMQIILLWIVPRLLSMNILFHGKKRIH